MSSKFSRILFYASLAGSINAALIIFFSSSAILTTVSQISFTALGITYVTPNSSNGAFLIMGLSLLAHNLLFCVLNL
jgi:hypothetical protein